MTGEAFLRGTIKACWKVVQKYELDTCTKRKWPVSFRMGATHSAVKLPR